tara:strand:- start:674 stop:1096 length:423 start_codon:yes stop_codon:yes gene_type:complete
MAAKKETTAGRRNTPKTKAKAKARTKVKMKEMTQTHAMEEKEVFEKTTLDQIWGDEGFSKYGTQDEEGYLSGIKSMNRSDLHSHAVKHGILPVDNRVLLTTRLLREFKKYLLAYKKPSKTQSRKVKNTSKKATSILAEGR